ncbi:MAG: hypothetical protein E7421_08190 [Ruminococcaceae bacterium]|nr:hypothetical protein [Oscillospiraceae bacterium]
MLLTKIPMSDAAITALLGYAIVFFGLILLMIVVVLLGKAFIAAEKRHAPVAPVAETPAPAPKTAPGSAGGVKLHNVEPKTAAMLMAIVANKMGKPINELRFISIKEVDE